MSKGPGSGDQLARGAVRATFTTTEGGITDKKWAEAFDDFEPEEFQAKPERSRLRSEKKESDE
jgi:hypothetical protein